MAFKTVWTQTLRRAKVPYSRIYDLMSTCATRLNAGGVADEWVSQLLRQGDSQVFKRYSQMNLQIKREENKPSGERNAGEFWHSGSPVKSFWHSFGFQSRFLSLRKLR